MAYDLEEQEKLEAIRAWWERYGTLCIVLAFVIVASIAGWRGWQWYQDHKATQAMGYFEALERSVAQPDEDATARIRAAANTLRTDFPDSGYASRGALVAAQALAQRGDLDAAKSLLEWLAGRTAADPAFAELARLRLASVLLQQTQYDQALAQLSKPSSAFAGLYADRRGDILLAQGKKTEARQAWEQALTALGTDPASQVVQLKIDALSGD